MRTAVGCCSCWTWRRRLQLDIRPSSETTHVRRRRRRLRPDFIAAIRRTADHVTNRQRTMRCDAMHLYPSFHQPPGVNYHAPSSVTCCIYTAPTDRDVARSQHQPPIPPTPVNRVAPAYSAGQQAASHGCSGFFTLDLEGRGTRKQRRRPASRNAARRHATSSTEFPFHVRRSQPRGRQYSTRPAYVSALLSEMSRELQYSSLFTVNGSNDTIQLNNE